MTNAAADAAYGRDDVAVSAKDIAFAALVPALFALAWTSPASLKRLLARSGSALRARLRPAEAADEARRLAAIFSGADADAAARAFRSDFYDERLQLFGQHRPFAPRLDVALAGREHLDRALAAGRGALLWVVPTVYSSVAGKAALWNAGFRVAHLSRTDHGFSGTRFGTRVLNPLRTGIERRFLDSRIVIAPGRTSEALAELTNRLAANGVVSITVGDRASRVMSVPFLGGSMRVATRPVDMARTHGAPLLPVVTIADADGALRTELGAPLPSADDHAAILALAAFMEPYARAHPGQFAGLGFLSAG